MRLRRDQNVDEGERREESHQAEVEQTAGPGQGLQRSHLNPHNSHNVSSQLIHLSEARSQYELAQPSLSIMEFARE